MKINRADLLWFLSNIRRRHEGKELTDEKLVDEFAHYMEANPRCIDVKNIDPNYDVIYNYKSSALYNTNGAIPTFVTVPTNKNFLINIQNDDVNAFTLPNNDKLTLILDRDLHYRQTVDIVIDANASATQNKQLEVFVNF